MEQRKAQRFELRLPVEVIRKGSENLSEHGQTRNMSSVGVLFEPDTGADLRIGEAVEYLITLPSSSDSLERVRLHCLGKVVRLEQADGVAATLERYEFVR
ncbi:MAG TPA: PilZ domain-containing protein [Bryobacteraceae bacterium]|nr:PilZ domain-containing protein [Bryobacteraceae bacterium]